MRESHDPEERWRTEQAQTSERRRPPSPAPERPSPSPPVRAVVVLAGLALLLVVRRAVVRSTTRTGSLEHRRRRQGRHPRGDAGATAPPIPTSATGPPSGIPTRGCTASTTRSVVDGRYVNVTTLPCASSWPDPLFAVGGYRAALLLVDARRGRRRLRRAGRSPGAAGADEQHGLAGASGLIGLASPCAALRARPVGARARASACMAWGVVAMVDTACRSGPLDARWPPALRVRRRVLDAHRGGRSTGSSSVGVGCRRCLWRRRGIVRRGRRRCASPPSASWPWSAANYAARGRRAGWQSLRTGRASGAASGWPGPTSACGCRRPSPPRSGCSRAPPPDSSSSGACAGAARWPGRSGGPRRARATGASPASPRSVAVLVFLLRAVDGLGFVPGLLVDGPVRRRRARCWPSTGGVARAEPRRRGCMVAGGRSRSCGSSSSVGGAVPQWGGRYVLTSGLVLAAVGIGVSGLLDRWVRNGARRAQRRASPCSAWPGCRSAPTRSVERPDDGRRRSTVRVVSSGRLLAAGARRGLPGRHAAG